jgi:hypothetical protein
MSDIPVSGALAKLLQSLRMENARLTAKGHAHMTAAEMRFIIRGCRGDLLPEFELLVAALQGPKSVNP